MRLLSSFWPVGLLLVLRITEANAWSFALSQASGTVTITEGGSVPMNNQITQLSVSTNPPSGSATNDAFGCTFPLVNGYRSYPETVYQKFELLAGAFQYNNFGTYCQLTQVAPLNCSSDLAGSTYLILLLQVIDLSQPSLASDVVDYEILITCTTTSTSTSTTTTTTIVPNVASTTAAFVNTPAGIATIVLAAAAGIALIGVATWCIMTNCLKPKPLPPVRPQPPQTFSEPPGRVFQNQVNPNLKTAGNSNFRPDTGAMNGNWKGTPRPQFGNTIPLTKVTV